MIRGKPWKYYYATEVQMPRGFFGFPLDMKIMVKTEMETWYILAEGR